MAGRGRASVHCERHVHARHVLLLDRFAVCVAVVAFGLLVIARRIHVERTFAARFGSTDEGQSKVVD